MLGGLTSVLVCSGGRTCRPAAANPEVRVSKSVKWALSATDSAPFDPRLHLTSPRERFLCGSPPADIQRAEPPRYVRGRVLFFPSSGRVEGRRKAVRSKALVSDQTVQDQRNCSSSVVPCTSSYIVLFFLQYVLPGFCSMLRKLKSTLKRKKKSFNYHPKSIFKSPHLQRIPSFLFVVNCILVL